MLKTDGSSNVIIDSAFNPKIFNGRLTNFATGALRTELSFGHGCYEVRLKPALSTVTYRLVYEFFLYGDGYVPGVGDTKNKIDIILAMSVDGSNIRVRTKVYTTHTEPGPYTDYFPEDMLEEDFHLFGMKWTPTTVTYYLDNKPFRIVDISNIPEFTLPLRAWHGMYGLPWTGGPNFARKFCRLETKTKLDSFRFTPGTSCGPGSTTLETTTPSPTTSVLTSTDSPMSSMSPSSSSFPSFSPTNSAIPTSSRTASPTSTATASSSSFPIFSPTSSMSMKPTSSAIVSSINVEIVSAGSQAGNMADFLIDGISVYSSGRPGFPRQAVSGFNVLVINEVTGEPLSVYNFNTMRRKRDSRNLRLFLEGIPENRIVAMAIKEDGTAKLHQRTRREIRSMGSRNIFQVQVGDSWAFITRMGHPDVFTDELRVRRRGGSARLSNKIELS